MPKRKKQGAYMISAVAEMYGIHPQTLRLYEREGLLKPSRTEGNTRLYTDEDLERLEFILSLARDLGVNISGIAIIIQMRERMDEMQRQMAEFISYVRNEVMARAQQAADPSRGAIVPLRHVDHDEVEKREMRLITAELSCPDRGLKTAVQAVLHEKLSSHLCPMPDVFQNRSQLQQEPLVSQGLEVHNQLPRER